jgi:DNA invertase Pin-like site-specific DNA recombinase
MTIRAALYARVSTRDKNQNPEVQLVDLRRMAKQRDWEIVGEYVDYARGKTTSREALDRLMADARGGKLDLIAFWRLDRFGRRGSDLIVMLDNLAGWNVGFVSLKDVDFDTTTAMGRFFLRFVASMAQLESEVIGERVSAGMAHAKEQGVKLGRKPVPFDIDVASTLLDHEWSLSRVAKAMNVSRRTLRRRLEEAGLYLHDGDES